MCLICIWWVKPVAVTYNLWDVKPCLTQMWQRSVHHPFLSISLNLSAFNVPIFRIIKTELWVKSAEKLVIKILFWVIYQFHHSNPAVKSSSQRRDNPKAVQFDITYFSFCHNCPAGQCAGTVSLLCLSLWEQASIRKGEKRQQSYCLSVEMPTVNKERKKIAPTSGTMCSCNSTHRLV